MPQLYPQSVSSTQYVTINTTGSLTGGGPVALGGSLTLGTGNGASVSERNVYTFTTAPNGTNQTFTISGVPTSFNLSYIDVYQQGLLLTPGIDYQLSGNQVNFTVAPTSSYKLYTVFAQPTDNRQFYTMTPVPNGTTTSFSFPGPLPVESYVDLYLAGKFQRAGIDYNLNITNGTYAVVFTTAPASGAVIGSVFDPSVNASRDEYAFSPAAGDGTTTTFTVFGGSPSSPYIDTYVGGLFAAAGVDYTLNLASGNWTVAFTTAPTSGATLASVFTSEFGSGNGNVSSVSSSSSVRGMTLTTTNGASAPTIALGYQTGDTPTIAAGAGAGTTPTISLRSGSTDVSGYITLTTGTTPTASATIATITFSAAYGSAPKVIFSPANGSAVGAPVFVSIPCTAAFVLNSSTALTAATSYVWAYTVTE